MDQIIREYDEVVLLRDFPEEHLAAGATGVVVDIHAGAVAYEVEFPNPAEDPRFLVVTVDAGGVFKLRHPSGVNSSADAREETRNAPPCASVDSTAPRTQQQSNALKIDRPEQAVLDYQRPIKSARSRHSPWIAVVLCMPGILCWAEFLGAATHLERIVPRFISPVLPNFFRVWFLAIICAIFSLFFYLRRGAKPRPWFVWVTVILNTIGLLFSIAAPAYAFYGLVHSHN